MPDAPQQTTGAPATPAAPSSPTPPSGTPTSDSASVPTSIVAPEYRYPDSEAVPAWARGKTAGEMLQLMQGVIEGVGRNPPAQVPVQPAAPLGDEDYVTARDLKAAQQGALSQLSPYLQSVADQQATMSYSLAKSKAENQAVFTKYEPEVIGVLQRVPRANWTLDVIDNAVTFVKGKHADELAADRVRQLESTLDSAMRSTGRAGLNSASPPTETVASGLAKTPDGWRARAKAVGITEDQIREFCWANETTPEEFFKQFGSGLITDAVAELNFGGKITI